MARMRGDGSSRNPGRCIWLVAVVAARHEAGWQAFSYSFGEEQSQLVFLYPAHYNGGAPSHSGCQSLKFTRFAEGLHLVVPSEFVNFFIASTGAAAALAGLLFCGRFSGAGADCNAAGTSGAASGRRQCLYRSDHCILPLDSRSDPPLQLGHLRSAL